MRYSALTDLGGFFWWLLIRHTKTTLNEEKTKEKWSRNLVFLIFLVYILGFVSVRIFKLI